MWAAKEFDHPINKQLKTPPGTGEIWLASDQIMVNTVAQGPLAGKGLDQVIARWPQWVLGTGPRRGLPVRTKILNVGHWLSVQVHPDDETAARLEGLPAGKAEAWHVLSATQNAEIIHGLRPGTPREDIQRALEMGTLPRELARLRVKAGQTFYLAPGVVHACGPGLVIFELQQASDLTYRFFDWERSEPGGRPRPLHLEQAMAAMRVTAPGLPIEPRTIQTGPNQVRLLVEDLHFSMLDCRVEAPYRPQPQNALRIFFFLEGSGAWRAPDREFEPQSVAAGQTWLLPAGLPTPEFTPEEGPVQAIECMAH